MTPSIPLLHAARSGKVVAFVGAGVSAAPPTSLPGWYPLNHRIATALQTRLEAALDRPGWLDTVVASVDAERSRGGFPPEYQAQLLEEACGPRYFQALQALDVDVRNAGHEAVADLAAAGALRAIVTTNFDRLIEHALTARGLPFTVARDEREFAALAADGAPLPLIKIHGCVTDALSMVDTLKQRKLGRSAQLQRCLDGLVGSRWLFLGFSGADLEGDPSYLGLVPGAPQSAGATWVAWPGSPELGAGAQVLMDAHGESGEVVIEEVPAVGSALCEALGADSAQAIAHEGPDSAEQFQGALTRWADALPVADAALCMAAILEAAQETEAAFRVLDRVVRRDREGIEGTEGFAAAELAYGRLGAAWGRAVSVPDLAGAESNISVETAQSLYRLQGTDQGYAAFGWAACLQLWLNEGQRATAMAGAILKSLVDTTRGGLTPSSDEEAVDAWLSAAQVLFVNTHQQTLLAVLGTAGEALNRARRCGDVVRAARVASLKLLALSLDPRDLSAEAAKHAPEFAEAERVGDAFALGMQQLALGRWMVGAGGLALAADAETGSIPRRALVHLHAAMAHFKGQGLDPWATLCLLQCAKAEADLGRFDVSDRCVDDARATLLRFPVLASHTLEVQAQIRRMKGDEEGTRAALRAALLAAEYSGLSARLEMLKASWLE